MTTINKEFEKDEIENLVLVALNSLCNGNTMQDARNLVLAKGLNENDADLIVRNANGLYQNNFKNKELTEPIKIEDIKNMNASVPVYQSYSENYEEDSSEFPSWIVWLALLGGINILSAIFDWPFWVY